MKVESSRAAARYFDLAGVRDAVPIEPVNPGTIHAYLFDEDPTLHFDNALKWILKQPGTAILEFGPVEAACGMAVRVVYRMSFDTEDPDACGRCLAMVNLWRTDRDEYHRKVRERHDRWRQRTELFGSGQYTTESPPISDASARPEKPS